MNEIFRNLAEKIIEFKKSKQSQQPVMKKNQRVGISMTSFEPEDNYGAMNPGEGLGGSSRGKGVRLTNINFEDRQSNNNSEN